MKKNSAQLLSQRPLNIFHKKVANKFFSQKYQMPSDRNLKEKT